MAWLIQIDREGEAHFKVSWLKGAQPLKSRILDSRDEAEGFARSMLGKRQGYIISTLDMTAAQLVAHHAKGQAL